MRQNLPRLTAVNSFVFAAAIMAIMPGTSFASHGQPRDVSGPTARSIEQTTLAMPEVVAELARYPGANLELEVHPSPGGDNFAVDIFDETTPILEVAVGADGSLLGMWTFNGLYTPGSFGGELINDPIVLAVLVMCFLLVLLPEGRRLVSLRTLDVLALAAMTWSLVLLRDRDLHWSLVAAYIPLTYLGGRMAWSFLRGVGTNDRGHDAGVGGWRLPTWGLLAIGSVALGARYVTNVTSHNLTDTGEAGYWGARMMLDGRFVYGNMVEVAHGDTYGPLNYVANIPGALLGPFAFDGDKGVFAAVAGTAILADALCCALVTWIAWRWFSQRAAAVTFAAWATCPIGAWIFLNNTNDALMLVPLVAALLLIGRPLLRGLLVGIAAGIKIVPLAVLPIVLRSHPRRDKYASAEQGAGIESSWNARQTIAVIVGAAIPLFGCLLYLVFNDHGVQRFWHALLGFHPSWRGYEGIDNIWQVLGLPNAVRLAVELLLAALIVSAAVAPRRRDRMQVTAGLGAALAATVIAAPHFWYGYMLWLVPSVLLMAAATARQPAIDSPDAVSSSTSANADRSRASIDA